jgi:hypothetical protein
MNPQKTQVNIGRKEEFQSLLAADKGTTNLTINQDEEPEDLKFKYDVTTGTALSTLSVSSLEEERRLVDPSKEHVQILNKISQMKRWRWGFCATAVLNLIIIALFIFIIVYFLFFRNPVFRVEQIQVLKSPTDLTMNVNVKLNIWNPNVQTLQLDKIYMILSVVSTMKNQPNPYVLELKDQPIKNLTRTSCGGMAFSTVDVTSSVRLNLIAQSLVLTHQYGFRLSGKVTYSILGVLQSQDLEKSQFVFQW